MDKTYIKHWGIKGQKWGVRRYQNADGSLTPAGKKRYVEVHEDYEKTHSRKSVKEMSNAELKARNNRLQMEKQYSDLTNKAGRGKKAVQTFITTAGTLSAVIAAYGTYKKIANGALDGIGNMIVKSINLSGPWT